MSIGHVVRIKRGVTHPNRTYVVLKNKSVWLLKRSLTSVQLDMFYKALEEGRIKIHLNSYVCVRDRHGKVIPPSPEVLAAI